MTDGEHTTIRTVIRWIAFFSSIFLLGYLALIGTAAFFTYKQAGGNGLADLAASMQRGLQSVFSSAWQFARPLLQLLAVLAIIDWMLKRLGIQLSAAAAATTQMKRFTWDVQAIIAVIVISAYAVAQLAGMGGEGMKDIALVVVGFYFGTQRRSYEVDPQTGKMRVIEDHTNSLAEGIGAARKVEGRSEEDSTSVGKGSEAQASVAAGKGSTAATSEPPGAGKSDTDLSEKEPNADDAGS